MRTKPTVPRIILAWLILLALVFGLPTWIDGWMDGLLTTTFCIACLFAFRQFDKAIYPKQYQH